MHADRPDTALRQFNIVGSSVSEGTGCRSSKRQKKMTGTKGYSNEKVCMYVCMFVCIYTQIYVKYKNLSVVPICISTQATVMSTDT
jgi:hypothetical protein